MHCLRGHHFANCLAFACLCRHRRNFIFDETSELSDYLCVLSKHKTNRDDCFLFAAESLAPDRSQDYFDECRNLRSPVFVRVITRSWKGDRRISRSMTKSFCYNISEYSINRLVKFWTIIYQLMNDRQFLTIEISDVDIIFLNAYNWWYELLNYW